MFSWQGHDFSLCGRAVSIVHTPRLVSLSLCWCASSLWSSPLRTTLLFFSRVTQRLNIREPQHPVTHFCVSSFSHFTSHVEWWVNRSHLLLQVLHQLKRLGMVWQDVLPVNIYCKAMGTLLNTAIAEMMGRITALEVRADTRLGCKSCPTPRL